MISYLFLIPPSERATQPSPHRIPSCFDLRFSALWRSFLQSSEIASTVNRLNTLVEKWGFLLRSFIVHARSQGLYVFRHDSAEADLDAIRSHLFRQRKIVLKQLTLHKWMNSLTPVPFTHRCKLSVHGKSLLLQATIRLRLPDGRSFRDLARYAKHTLRFSGSPANLFRSVGQVNFNLRRVSDTVASLSYRITLPSVSPAAFGRDVRTNEDLAQAVFDSVCVPILRSNAIPSLPRHILF